MSTQRLTTDEVAEQLRTDRFQVTRWILQGALRASKPGRRWLIEQADVDAYVASTANRAPDARRRRKRAS